jgi:acyl carrier protein
MIMHDRGTEFLEQEVSGILRDQLMIEVPGPEADLISMGTLDSLLLVDLLVRIEEKTGVSIPLEEVELSDLRSVRSIGALLARRIDM